MRLGLLADIHGRVDLLRLALDAFRQQDVDQVVVLGDIYEMGDSLRETVMLLRAVSAIGVWGNHDLGFCHEPEPWLHERFSSEAVHFMASLKPKWEIGPLLFTHGVPFWDPTDPTVYYLGPTPRERDTLTKCFQDFSHRIMFIGHFHRWLIATPSGLDPWDGSRNFHFLTGRRYLVQIHAVMEGWSAIFDTENDVLVPIRLS